MNLEGLIPATVTPFDAAGAPDTDALAAHLDRLCSIPGIVGVAVNMDTGEGPSLTGAERRSVIEVAADAARSRVPVIAGVGGASTSAACDAAKAASGAGADAIVVFPHPAFHADAATIVPHHAAVIGAGECPALLFQLQPSLGGVIFDRETLTRLCRIDGVIALKEASFDADVFAATRDVLRPTAVTLLTGNDNFVFDSLVLGARGSLIGLGSVLAGVQADMHGLVAQGDIAKARALNADVVAPLADLLFAPPVGRYRARVKCALAHVGEIASDDVRAPLLPLHPDEAGAVRAGLDALCRQRERM